MWAARGPRGVVIGLLNENMLNHLHGGATWSRIALGQPPLSVDRAVEPHSSWLYVPHCTFGGCAPTTSLCGLSAVYNHTRAHRHKEPLI